MPGPKSNPPPSILNRAKTLFDEGRLAEAEEVLRGAGDTGAPNPPVLNFRAYLLYRLGRTYEAEKAYRRLAELTPEDPAVFSNLGLISFKAGMIEQARESFERVLQLVPGDRKALRNLGHCHTRLGDAGKAAECFRKAGVEEGAGKGGTAAAPPCREVESAVPPPSRVRNEDYGPHPDGVALQRWAEGISLPPPPAGEIVRTGAGMLVWHIDEKVFLSRHYLHSHRGVVLFSSASREADRAARKFGSRAGPLVRAEGTGEIVLSGRGSSLNLFRMEEESRIFVNYPSLVCCGLGTTLSFSFENLRKGSFLVTELQGSDLVVLAARGCLTVLSLPGELPTFVRSEGVVAWTGNLSFVHEEVSLPGSKFFGGGGVPHLRFEGRGHLLLQDLPQG